MHRTSIFISLALGFGGMAAMSCVQTSYSLDPTHCSGAQDGDSFCSEQYADGSKPYCRFGSNPCNPGAADDIDGCVAERPEDECYSPCGQGNTIAEDRTCLDDATTVADGSGSTGETEGPSTTEGPDTGSSTDEPTTTGLSGCMSDAECLEEGAPFCDPDGNCVACDGMPEPDAACEGADVTMPVCDAGACVQCTETNTAACEGTTPICGASNVCEGCTEHAQCPDSACHLDGPDAGACFDVADVQMVANTAALETALGALSTDEDVVLVLTGSDYSGLSVDLVASAEVAILGDGSQTLSGNSSGAFFGSGGSSIVYLAGATLAGNVSGDGLSCSGTSVWLDDAEVRNNAQVGMDVSGGCEAHLRRTVVRANSEGGIDQTGGELSLENSVVAGNGGSFSAFGGVSLDGVDVGISYTTIAGNDSQNAGMSFRCNGTNTGGVRNSIVVGADPASVDCSGPVFESSAVDETGLGATNQMVGAFDAGWFSNPGAGDFGLTASGETEFMDIAQWAEGDPLFDFEGDAIPTDVPSFPGYDQP